MNDTRAPCRGVCGTAGSVSRGRGCWYRQAGGQRQQVWV